MWSSRSVGRAVPHLGPDLVLQHLSLVLCREGLAALEAPAEGDNLSGSAPQPDKPKWCNAALHKLIYMDDPPQKLLHA